MTFAELAIEALKGAVVGAVIGYATNQLAIWMLFHPRRPVVLFGWRLPFTPGLVVKNQARLAESVARTVSRNFLDAETLVQHLRGLSLHKPIAEALESEREGLLASHESVLEKAGAANRDALLALKSQMSGALAERLPHILRGIARLDPEAKSVLAPLAGQFMEKPLGALLSEADRGGIRDAAEEWIHGFVRANAFGEVLAEIVARHAATLFNSPAVDSLRGVAEGAISEKTPMMRSAVQDALADFAAREDLGVVARERLGGRLHAMIVERFPRIGRLLGRRLIDGMLENRWPEIVEEMQAFFLGDVFARFLDEKLDEATGSAADAMVAALRKPEMQEQMAAWLQANAGALLAQLVEGEPFRGLFERGFERLWALTPRALLGVFTRAANRPPGWFVERAAVWLESEEGTRAARTAADALIEHAFLRQEVRRLAALVPEAEWEVIARVTSEVIEQRVLRALPWMLTQHLDLEQMIRTKVQALDPAALEEAIASTSENELKGIVRLGGVIGLVVGAVAQLVEALTG